MKKVLSDVFEFIRHWIFECAVFLAVYFSAVLPSLLAITFFVICDTITGTIASVRLGEPFTSRRLRDSFTKLLGYGIGILVALVFERQFMPDIAAVKMIAAFLAYIELKSINENIEKLTGKNIFNSVIKTIKR